MLYKIELETILNKAKKILKIDELKEKLMLITTFFENVQNPIIDKSKEWDATDILSSSRYNEFLSACERDVSLIYDSQTKVKNDILVNWNNIEQIKQVNETTEEFYDTSFVTEFPLASQFINVTLSVDNKISKLNNLKTNPHVSATTNNTSVTPYHGKKYGAWIASEITNEDGIRAENIDTTSLVDQKDSFYEVEAVTLQDEYTDVIYDQEIIENDLNMTLNIKFIFNEPQKINYITVKPHNYATGSYYDLTGIVISDGVTQQELDMEPIMMNVEKTITFESPFEEVSSVYLVFKQEHSYFIKYTVGNFLLDKVNYLIDVTGDSLLKDVSNYDDPVAYIKYKMDNIEKWILDVWHPDIPYESLPELNTILGEEGFQLIDSRESRRKRCAIGIEDIDIGENSYADKSEIITDTIKIEEGTNIIQLAAKDNGKGLIYYYISFDDGLNWRRIDPVGTPKVTENFRIVPQKIYINSDLSEERQSGTEAGVLGFVRTKSEKIRIKAVLIKGEEGEVPEVEKIEPIFLNYE